MVDAVFARDMSNSQYNIMAYNYNANASSKNSEEVSVVATIPAPPGTGIKYREAICQGNGLNWSDWKTGKTAASENIDESVVSFMINIPAFSFIKYEIIAELAQPETKSRFVYLNEDRLKKVKSLIQKQDVFFTDAYDQLIIDAVKELTKVADPVTNKTQTPPSGDKHDYLSLAPYRWPNPATADGFPWIVKDGQINPMTRGDHTDHGRLAQMFNGLNVLSMAYYFSGDTKYADKAKANMRIWFIDKATKVNPNVNFGQGIPGELDGRRAGIIEWTRSNYLINTIQILSADGLLPDEELQALNTWLSDYYTWLKTHRFGTENDNGLQNHSTCYDFQMVGIARYLGLSNEAKSRLEASKIKRIKTQITPQGEQPRELGRTKSVHYCSMNLRMMTLVAELGTPLGVDLLNYSTSDGASIRKAYEFLRPFAQGDKKWTRTQIGGAEKAIQKEMVPIFSIASTIYGQELIDKDVQAYQALSYIQKLQYPPLFTEE